MSSLKYKAMRWVSLTAKVAAASGMLPGDTKIGAKKEANFDALTIKMGISSGISKNGSWLTLITLW